MLGRQFAQDRRGAVAIIFALSLLPLAASVGAAVDYSRMEGTREKFLRAGDRTALAVATSDNPGASAAALEALRRDLAAMPGIVGSSATGRWLDASQYQVDVTGRVNLSVMAAVPGMPSSFQVATTTTVRRIPAVFRVLPPKTSLLEPEAGDYNRMYLYCYNPKWREKTPPDPTKGRRDFVPIADNATPPTDFAARAGGTANGNNGNGNNGNGKGNGNNGNNGNGNNGNGILNGNNGGGNGNGGYRLPECTAEEIPAYMMRNVRNSRTDPSRWDTETDYYEYFTDSELDRNTGVVVNRFVGEYISSNRTRSAVDLTNRPMLETILCNNEAECRPIDRGGILPTRRTDRSPAVATGVCAPGKFMYYGYEDRPGGDRDYDDIRLIISCPELEKIADKRIQIIR